MKKQTTKNKKKIKQKRKKEKENKDRKSEELSPDMALTKFIVAYLTWDN